MKKYIINICIDEDRSFFATYNEEKDIIEIDLTLLENDRIEDFLQKDYLNENFIFFDDDDENNIEKVKNMLKDADDNIYENSDIQVEFYNGVGKYIEKNLKGKKVYINNVFNINYDDYNELINEIGNTDNIMVMLDGNSHYVTVNEYKRTIDTISYVVSTIEKYNLSSFEKIMVAYDLIRDREYNEEDATESSHKSRDLTSVLLGNNIVCVGFSNIFEKVLNLLDIKNRSYTLKDSENGHMRNMAYIKDPKYNIDGVYYFDLTWDSKKSENDNSFLKSYRFFGLTRKGMMKFDRKILKDDFLGDFNEKYFHEFYDFVKIGGIKNVPTEMIEIFNNVSKFIDNKNVINCITDFSRNLFATESVSSFNLEETLKVLNKYWRIFFRCNINPDVFLKLLYNVRKVEYNENPEKYSLNIEDLEAAVLSNDEYNYKVNKYNSLIIWDFNIKDYYKTRERISKEIDALNGKISGRKK